MRNVKPFQDRKRPAAVQGRGVLIIIITVVAASCFALGYFVGKNSVSQKVITKIVEVPAPVDRPADDPIKNQEITVIEEAPAATAQTKADQQDATRQRTLPPKKTETSATKTDTAKADTSKTATNKTETAKTAASAKQASTAKTDTAKSTAAAKSDSSKATASTADEGKYSVQAGAFKAIKDAETLKTKLAAKGYKVYVLRTEPKNGNAVMFKVKVGNFADKDSASRMALKLKSAENIAGFVTKSE